MFYCSCANTYSLYDSLPKNCLHAKNRKCYVLGAGRCSLTQKSVDALQVRAGGDVVSSVPSSWTTDLFADVTSAVGHCQ